MVEESTEGNTKTPDDSPALLKKISYRTAGAPGKYSAFLKTVIEVMNGKFGEKEVTEIPEFDTSKYGELVSY
ncbi:MAG: hypothetical protein PHH85_05000, partial [Candidatus Methanoperedens sp.]|nr:hypothetical protein [Candidatus Methanoperedens sp.]